MTTPQPGELIPDPECPGRLCTVDHVIEDDAVLRVGTITGRVILLPREDA